MFGTIRKHQTWLWVAIIAVMIVGLINWQSNIGKSGNGQRAGGEFGIIDGRLITATEFRNAETETKIAYFIRTHEWPDIGAPRPGWDQTLETYKRLFLVRKLDQYNIRTDSDLVARTASSVLQGFGNGQTVTLELFVERVLAPHGFTQDDFERFIQHDLSIGQLASTFGASGQLTPPSEIQSLYIQVYQQVKVDLVPFSASNYLAAIPEPTPEVLGQFYSNMEAEYRLPDQLLLSYVFFNITNFLPGAEQKLGTNLARMVDEKFNELGTNVALVAKTPEEAKNKIRESFIRLTAYTNALEKAQPFATEAITNPVGNLDAIAKKQGLEARVTQPFDSKYGPADIHLGSSYPVSSLFELSADDPFVDRPVQGSDGFYILAFNKLIPSHVPSLEEIRSRVVADYKFAQAMRMAQANGASFARTATSQLAQGKTFGAITASANVKSISVPAFSQSTETLPEVEPFTDLETLKAVTFGTSGAPATPVGHASGFEQTSQGGIVVYVRERLPIDETKMAAELPQFAKQVRQQREADAFNLWFSKEANDALRGIPALQSRQQGRSS